MTTEQTQKYMMLDMKHVAAILPIAGSNSYIIKFKDGGVIRDIDGDSVKNWLQNEFKSLWEKKTSGELQPE